MNHIKKRREDLIKHKYQRIREARRCLSKCRKSSLQNRHRALVIQNQQRTLRNRYEIRFRELLLLSEIRFTWQNPFYDHTRYVCVDFFLPDYNLVVEIDGCIHKKRVRYDKERTRYLKDVHLVSDVIRITNDQITHESDDILEYVLGNL